MRSTIELRSGHKILPRQINCACAFITRIPGDLHEIIGVEIFQTATTNVHEINDQKASVSAFSCHTSQAYAHTDIQAHIRSPHSHV